MFGTIPTINTNYFPEQHEEFGLYNENGLSFLFGRKRNFTIQLRCQPSRLYHGSGRCHSIMVKSRVRSRARFVGGGQNDNGAGFRKNTFRVSLNARYSSSCYSYREDKREDLGTFKSNALSVTGEH